MAAAKSSRAMPVGSSQWIQNEREQAAEFVGQEVEEFGYSVRNELEWLDEHMADIFSKTAVNFADMFKTPGKLRGKTPRTARKVNALPPRQPLTDIFSAPNGQPAQPSAQTATAFYDKVAQFQISAEDDSCVPTHKPIARGTSPQRAGKPYTDSGYHGMMTEDEAELTALTQTDMIAALAHDDEAQKVPLRENQPPPQRLRDGNGEDAVTSDDSFVSAKEPESEAAPALSQDMENIPGDTQPFTQEDAHMLGTALSENVEVFADDDFEDDAGEAPAQPKVDDDADMDGSAHSDASSPEKPLNRKSSFTFSSLPAREALSSKRSMGQMDAHRSSVFNKSTGTKTADFQSEEPVLQERAAETRAHSKTTAQLLHDRINMLGKTKEPRLTKSIPASALASEAAYPQLPSSEEDAVHPNQTFEFPQKALPADPDDDDEDDWIAPTKKTQTLQGKTSEATTQPPEEEASPVRPGMHHKSISTTFLPSPSRYESQAQHQKATSVSHPNLREHIESTTPAGSPSRKQNEGHLSASKNKLWSAFKSAKSIFASSASTSAAAKIEAHTNTPSLSRTNTNEESVGHKLFNMPGAIWSKTDVMSSPARNNSTKSFSPSRKTRNSDESDKKREKELKAQEKAAADLEKAREKERQKAAKQLAEENAKIEKAAKVEAAKVEKENKARQQREAKTVAARPESAGSEKVTDNEMAPPPPPKSNMLPAGKLRAPGRLLKPTKEGTKPAPTNIRVASQAQRAAQGPQAPPSFSKSQYGDLASSTTSQTGPTRVGSAQGHRPGTAGGNSRVRALEAAARKKEADEKAAQKKADQKRELEQKRAEKVEREKRAEEERKAAEQQRVQEAKLAAERKAAEKQAADQRKREQQRAEQQKREEERFDQQRRDQERLEQQRQDAERARQQDEARRAKEAHDLAEAIRREREQRQQAQQSRGDVPGTLRQLTKNTIVAVNPAKPSKRPLPEDDEPQRPGIVRGGLPSYQQTDAKRRRTNEEQDEQPNQRTSVMAPPKRPSTMRKETMPKYSGYTHAPPPAAHHASMFKSTVTAQHQMQHGNKPIHPSQLVQTSNARIPFADNKNPPAPHQLASSSSYYDASKFKTPSRPAQAPKSAKSTPHYPQGDNIELPDIATDSEDEEDEEDGPEGFRAPSWTASPALRDLLTQQQLMDPEAVFGPIGELKMDEVFKNNKNQERLKRFRERGSSAMWHETGDAVTSAEKRKDMEIRERVAREGGWRFEPNA